MIITARAPLLVEAMKEYFDMSDVDEAVFNYTLIPNGQTVVVKNTAAKDFKAFICGDFYDRVTYDAAGDISSSDMAENSIEQEFTSEMSKAFTAINGSITIIALNNIFTVNDRNYPALMRKTVYGDEKFVFVNAYDEKCVLHNSNNKLNYAIYTETNSAVDAKNETFQDSMKVPAGGRVEVEIKSANITFAGPYEAFSGEDLSVKVTGVTLSSNTLNMVKGRQALYISEDNVIATKVYSAAERVDVNFTSVADGEYVKIMWWNDNLKPLCKAEYISLNH